jgi:DNA helicase-2/ATP-dependent DNA helicase PcrA
VAEYVVANGHAPDESVLDRLLADTMFVPFASAQAWETMRGSARRLVVRYLAEHADELTRVWGVERPFSLFLDEGVIRGRADVVLDGEAGAPGRLAVVDYKVSHDEAREARYREQLVVYAAAGRAEGLDVHAAYLYELKDGARHPVDVDELVVTTAVTRLGSQLARLSAGEFGPTPDAGRCARCEQRRVCRHAPAD